MRILIYSQVFWPSVGGLEAVMQMIAEEVAGAGHEVRVATLTPAGPAAPPAAFPFEIVRSPSRGALGALMASSDLVVLGGLTLKGFWPALLRRRPLVITHHGRYIDDRWPPTWPARVKLFVARFADDNISCSDYVARQFAPGVRSWAIPNCYDGRVFGPDPAATPDRDVAFVGRLVSDKGADVLVEALGLLAQRDGLHPTATIVGGGPEAEALQAQAQRLGVAERIVFTGSLPAAGVAGQLRRHRVMVVPSRWNEPFGIVALEGIACGCVVVASSGGGLPEAVGPCGLTFPNNDAPALAAQLKRVLTEPGLIDQLRARAPEHLAAHSRQAVGRRYVEAFEAVLKRRGRR